MQQLFDRARILLFFGFVVNFTSCENEPVVTEPADKTVYFCGAENLVYEGDRPFFDDGKGKFVGGGHQVKDIAFEGNCSIKLDSLQPYGMPFTLTDVVPGEFFETSAWFREPSNNATITASISGKTTYTLTTSEYNKVEEKNGWTKYQLSFAIETPIDSLTFFLFSGSRPVYCDNFEIVRYKTRPATAVDPADVMRIYVPDSAMTVLESYKAQALEQDIISSDMKEYVQGFILDDGDSIPIELRLKGDWTDHLTNGKTSYRIKASQTYRGLRSFSIQHPGTRNYLHEWFVHQLFDREGLLTTTYDFVSVEINGTNHGIYAMEEHFDDELLESRDRPDGPIIKMDETGFWALLARGKKESLMRSYPYFEGSMVTAFRENRIEKSPSLSEQFVSGAALLQMIKDMYPKPGDILDLEQTAKYYALIDLANAPHSLAWHNRRFYYNPVTARLEMIGFDMIPAGLPMNPLLAQRNLEIADSLTTKELALDYYLFADPEFRNYYSYYVSRYSSVAYLDSMFAVLDSSIVTKEKLLRYEFPNHHLNRGFYYEKGKVNLSNLAIVDSIWKTQRTTPSPNLKKEAYDGLSNDFFLHEISLNIYQEEVDSLAYEYTFENYHLADVTITGYAGEKDAEIALEKPITIKAFSGPDGAPSALLTLPVKTEKFYFEATNVPGEKQYKHVFAWPKPGASHPRIDLAQKFSASNKLYRIKGDTLVISAGQHVLTDLIYVPRNYVARIEAGAEIDIIEKGGLIFNNSVEINGTHDQPVIISSSDSSSRGIAILEPGSVYIANATFINQDALNYKGWRLNGALTIYEGDVHLENVEFKKCFADDALNIIRAQFDIDHLTILDTRKDAFDADFSDGNLSNAAFVNTPSDCIDSTGSSIKITDITINNSSLEGGNASDFDALRIENEIKLTVPQEIVPDVWSYLTTRYDNNDLYLRAIDSTFNSKIAEDLFTDQYFDNDRFEILKTQNGIRHRSRIVLTDPNNRKNGRQLMQLKVNNISTNLLNRGEFKYPIKYYETIEEKWDGHPFLGNVQRKYRKDLVNRLEEYGVDAEELHPTILCKQLRQRIYLFRGLDPFATLTLDHVTAHFRGDSAKFTELELELNEINYTEGDSASRVEMEAINDDIKGDILEKFPSIVQDQTPKYNKSADRLGLDIDALIQQNSQDPEKAAQEITPEETSSHLPFVISIFFVMIVIIITIATRKNRL